MLINPSLVLFLVCLVSSIFMVLSSPSLFFSWVGLELNTLSFIPLILNTYNKKSSESAIKYFLTQTLASILFLLGATFDPNSMVCHMLVLVSLLIKLGAAPFHSWLPGIVESMSWTSLFILLTIQKINPLLIMINPQWMLFSLFPIWMSLIIGAIMGLTQTQIRSILTYSSINHMGWMLVAWMESNYLLMIYFFSYLILLSPLVILFNKINCSHLNNLTNLPMPLSLQFITFFLLLSLGGLPPFMGFMPKLLVIQELLEAGTDLETCFLLVLMSLITLFYYLRITFSAFILSNSKWNFLSNKLTLNQTFFLMATMSLLGLGFMFIT